MARELDQHGNALGAYAAFLRAAVAYVRFLRARGRLVDEESTADLAALETEYERISHHLVRRTDRPVPLPHDPTARLAHAARRQLLIYREAVLDESQQLRAASGALLRRSREQRSRRAREAGPRSASR